MSEWIDGLPFALLVAYTAIALVSCAAVFVTAGFALERALGAGRTIYGVSVPEGQLVQETLGTLRFLAMASVTFALLLHLASHAPTTTRSFWITFGTCWASFEVLYWILHRAMHTRRGYRFHRYHHDSRVMTPMTGYSMSTVESAGWLVALAGPPALLSLAMPISVDGFAAYMLYNMSGNIVGHSNVEPFGTFLGRRAASWAMHPITYHALHHARVTNHYGFGSTFMDRWMRTEWADWPTMHARVRAGRPISRFTEKA